MTLHRSIIKALIGQPMALADLQAATSVSLPTLRKAVQELIDSRWICVVGQAEANGGRPAMLFGLDSRHYIIVGVHLQLPGMCLIASDLTGKILDEANLFSKVVPSPGDTVNAIVAYVAHIRAAYPDRQVLGIGVATPGFIAPNSGDILTIVRVPGWQNFPICWQLQATLGVPVHAANDVDCMAFAEFQYARETNGRNLAYVGFDEGVKVSLFLKGKLYRGGLGNAGLISSSLLHVEGVGNRQEIRELLTLVGISDMFERRVTALDAADQQVYLALLTENTRQRVSLIWRGAQDGLPVCQEIAQKVIQVLSAAVANVIYLVQPDVVVIGGVLSQMPSALFTDLRMAIAAHLPGLIENHVVIQQARLSSPNSAAIGATQHFLQCHLSNLIVDTWQLT